MASLLRRSLWPTLATAVALAILVSLGNWQLQRLAWKQDLIARVGERTALAPVDLPAEADWPKLDPDTDDYRPVRVAGRFLDAGEAHVFTALSAPKGRQGGQGYWVMTPLALDGGGYVVVNRGFVPLDRKDPATRPGGRLDGTVTLTGLLRRPEGANAFTPADDRAANIWFTRDPRAIAAAAGLPRDRTLPFYVDADAASTPPGGLPQGGETVVSFTNNHLQYAVTWFGLALTLVGVYIAFMRARLRAD